MSHNFVLKNPLLGKRRRTKNLDAASIRAQRHVGITLPGKKMRVGQAMGLRNNNLSRGNSAILGQVADGQ